MAELEDRVQDLELTSDIQSTHVSLFKEIIEMFKELSVGRAFINRATNRSKLRHLKEIVLPRRLEEIQKLKAEPAVPAAIKKLLLDNAMGLYNKAEHDAIHRLHFEKQSVFKVRSIYDKLQKIFSMKRTHPQIQMKK